MSTIEVTVSSYELWVSKVSCVEAVSTVIARPIGVTDASCGKGLVLVLVDADLVEWLGTIQPKVHHDSEVLGVFSCSVDADLLCRRAVTVTQPDYITSVDARDDVAAITAEDRVPSCAATDGVVATVSVQNVFAGTSLNYVIVISSMDDVVSESTE